MSNAIEVFILGRERVLRKTNLEPKVLLRFIQLSMGYIPNFYEIYLVGFKQLLFK